MQVTTAAGFNRDLLCLTYSADREWLYAGSSSGDFICVNVRVCLRVCCAVDVCAQFTKPVFVNATLMQVKTGIMQGSIYTCSGGVTSIVDVTGGSTPGLIVGGGDGSVTVFQGTGKVCTQLCSTHLLCSNEHMISSQDLVDFSRRRFDGAIRSLSACE